ncbi:hypothetical protein KU41_08850 (plasmid) [Clostridium botulinum]|uniref:Uncharacterized protein n=1 Tax=Clostridium botulinum TaxID=1491 RepID=A0A093VNA6_CLOBO|nr:hypothetical protein [Clostridium botulinum]AIW54928.1 hypothetical protein [Clostridium botulinum]AIW54983.1 hypothetical protein [Clostridium botulinum]AIW55038.1 hypothetical protein [Clostridium botulinum]KFX53725.1 hypothetical protein KU40_19170 [Clostridium botulinum]
MLISVLIAAIPIFLILNRNYIYKAKLFESIKGVIKYAMFLSILFFIGFFVGNCNTILEIFK